MMSWNELNFFFCICDSQWIGGLGSVWYMCLKIENCCLKTFVEIRVGEKVYWNMWNAV